MINNRLSSIITTRINFSMRVIYNKHAKCMLIETVSFDGKYYNVSIPQLDINYCIKSRNKISGLTHFLIKRHFTIRKMENYKRK